MHTASHAVCFERLIEAAFGAVLSTDAYGCSWFSFGFAVCVFLLAAHSCFVWTSNGFAMRVFLVFFGQGILSPLNELNQVRSGLMNCQWLLSQGMLKTGKYLLIPYFMGITCG
jgi:hypothetical protein